MHALETLRLFKGDSYEHTFQNRSGNICYYLQDYAGAANHYRRAIAANDKEPAYYSNLALALENIKSTGTRQHDLEEAIRLLNRALTLAPNNTEYAAKLAALNAEHAFVQIYGEDALKFDPIVTPIQIEIANDVLPDILDST
jgi:tetratricopeptide (TPR) repeat protein